MTKHVLRIALGAVVLLAARGEAWAQKTITVTFDNASNSSSVMATCEASMSAADKKLAARRNESITWELKRGTCSTFDPTNVSIAFATDLFPSRTLSGTSGGIKYKTTKLISRAKNGSVHPYFILYEGVFAGDPEIDVNGDCCGAPGPPGTTPPPGSGSGSGARSGARSGSGQSGR